MVIIEVGKEFKIENVLSLRKKMTQLEIQQEMMNIGKILEQKGLKKNGPIVTATFTIEQSDEQQLLDIEILVPLNKPAQLQGMYRFKEVFHLVNAAYARHEGNPIALQNTYNDIDQYIRRMGLQIITSAYNVNIVELSSIKSMDEMIIDVYIGLNPSKL